MKMKELGEKAKDEGSDITEDTASITSIKDRITYTHKGTYFNSKLHVQSTFGE